MLGQNNNSIENAQKFTIEELTNLAKTDPSLRPLLDQILSGNSNMITTNNQSKTAIDTITKNNSSQTKISKEIYSVCIEGTELYRWSQSLDEVLMFIPLPQGIPSNALHCTIGTNHLTLGIKNYDRNFIDEALFSTVSTDASFMTVEDDNIVIYLHKACLGEVWEAPLYNHVEINGMEAGDLMDLRRRLMIERLNKENKGFNFTNAQFEGDIPDPHLFMGGINPDRV